MSIGTENAATSDLMAEAYQAFDEGLVIVDGDMRLVNWNAHYAALGLIDPTHLHKGADVRPLVEQIAKHGVYGTGDPSHLADRRYSEMKAGHTDGPSIVELPDRRHLHIRRFPLPGGGLCVAVRDITDEIETKAQLDQSVRLEAVGRMTAGLAHDMNNLIAVIIGNLELARDGFDIASTEELIDTALNAATQSGELIGKLLAFARQRPLKPSVVQPEYLVFDLNDMLKSILGPRCNLHIRCTETVWPVVVDQQGLDSAIVNLTVNARDAMDGMGDYSIHVSNERVGVTRAGALGIPAGNYVCIACSDTGTGMTPEIRERALEPFFTTKELGKGTGLGLSMVHGFIQQSGGAMRIDTCPGEGTEVRLYLPTIDQLGTGPALEL